MARGSEGAKVLGPRAEMMASCPATVLVRRAVLERVPSTIWRG
jgi:hypothetical protein